MVELARRHPAADPLTTRALNQAARELMLAQSSDWTFIMKTGTTVPYATKRINQHILQFNKIYDDLRANKLQATANEAWLADVESRDNIFPNVDYRIYAS
jgi:1,4-alpha-glucan branching enzyme